MVLYTPMDMNAVLADNNQPRGNYEEISPADGLILVVEPVARGYRIERVISANSDHYLNAEYQPGQIIKLS